MKRLRLCIAPEMEGKKLETVLKEEFHLTKRQISQAKFREQGILINERQVRSSYICQTGDVLDICVEEQRTHMGKVIPKAGMLKILYEDSDVLVVHKPGGVSCHPGRGHHEDSLANRVAAYFQDKGEHTLIRPVGRLDKDTSGIMLYAKNQIAAARLGEQKEQGDFQKEYLVLVQGEMEEKQGRIQAPIGKLPGEKLKMCVDRNGKAADTCYEVLNVLQKENCTYSLVRCRIFTGRTHQIRVHMAWSGHPVVGDVLYGSKKNPFFPGLALHAARIFFVQPYRFHRIEMVDMPFFWEIEVPWKKGLTSKF